jgi:hypothetical protein
MPTGGYYMCNKNSFGKMPYEHIPDGLPDPAKQTVKKIPLVEMLRRIKEKHRKPESKNGEVRK